MLVPAKRPSSYPWLVRLFLWRQKRKYGRVLGPALLWGRSPWVFAALALLYGALDRKRSPLDAALRSLVTVRVSQLNHCAFCVDINSATLLMRGVAVEKAELLQCWRESGIFSERERTCLEFAEAMTRSELDATDALVQRLRSYFDNDAIVELAALIAFQNMSSKFNAALGVPPQGFCQLPKHAVESVSQKSP